MEELPLSFGKFSRIYPSFLNKVRRVLFSRERAFREVIIMKSTKMRHSENCPRFK